MSDRPRICFIVAVSNNHTIGRENTLPWKLRNDLQRFKRLTMGYSMLMGRKTFESLPKVLPGRKSIVLTSNPSYRVDHPDVRIVHRFEEALQGLAENDKLFVIGGATIFQQQMDKADEILLTRVLAHVEGDTFLNPFDLRDWRLMESEYVPMDDRNDYPSRFEHWVRNR